MDIRKTLDEISNIEREKAQLELRQKQLEEEKDKLAKRLADMGISAKDLDGEIARLESSITERLEAIRKGPIKQAASIATDDDLEASMKML